MDRRLIMLLFLAGCAGSVDAPSLAPRAIERAGVPSPDAAAEPAGAVDPALGPKLEAILAAARDGHRHFDEARSAAEKAAARPGANHANSDAWTEAQQALSALEAARADVRAASADLDMLRIDPAFAAAANRDAVDQAAVQIAALDEQEGRAIDAIGAKLGQP